ncbi:MAG: MFS transporter, partial [Proteobacteria bacterium]|nr:MFS transporter [Pseudomonadota bacterium]
MCRDRTAIQPSGLVAWGVFAILLGTLVVPLDSAVNVDFPSITRHFGLPIPLIQWIVISYTLTTASLMLVFGRAADMLGYRRMFLAGCAWNTAAFVLCAIAPGYAWLLAARILQGIGAGLVLSCGPALITALYPETQRARALGIYTLGFGLGGALGPALGGLLTARFGWSAVFWARAPVAALGGLAGLMLPATPRRVLGERFDLAGATWLVLAIGTLLLALNRFRTPIIALPAAAGAALALAGFIRQEGRARHPMLDLRPFRDPGFALANIGNALMNLAAFAVLLLVPFALARLPWVSTAAGGLVLAASPAGVMLGGPLAGRLALRVPAGVLMATSAGMVAAGLACVAGSGFALAALIPGMLAQGIGLGMFQVAYFDVVTGAIPMRDRGVAGSLGMLTRTLGLVAGATVLMSIFQTVRDSALLRGTGADAAFGLGFRTTFLCAAALPALLVLVALARR